MKDKTKNILMGVAGVVLIAAVAGNTVYSVMARSSMDKMSAMLEEYVGSNNDEDVAQEDDVTIADEYVIRSTLPISDAYKSGDNSKLDDKQKETLDMASKVLDEIIKEDMSDYEKELAVYQWMTTKLQNDEGLLTVIPNTQADCDNPYGVLKYHNAVCVGYATTFRMFMQMMDIECMVVHNTERYHSWDLCKIDGEWYHTDIYSDAGSSNYANFNMNDAMCKEGHDWNTDFFPAANGIKYNYGYQNKKEAKDVYDVPAIVRTALDDEETCIGIDFKSAIEEEDAQVVESMMNCLTSMMSADNTYANYSLSWAWSKMDDGKFMLFVTISSYGEQEETIDLTEEQQEKASEVMEGAFGDLLDMNNYTPSYISDENSFGGDVPAGVEPTY